MCLEWWAFEILGLLAGLLPEATTEIGANAIMFNTTAVTYMFYLGVSIASTVRVGNGLGEGQSKSCSKICFGIFGDQCCDRNHSRFDRVLLQKFLASNIHNRRIDT